MGAVTILILAHFAVSMAVLWPVIPPLLYGFFNFPHSRTQVIGAFLVFLFCSVLPVYNVYHYVTKPPYQVRFDESEES